MGSISNYLEDKLLNHVLNQDSYSPSTTVYLGLSTADPLDDASGLAEPSGNGYSRKAITFGAASSRRVMQNADITFDQATGDWGTITHWALFDAATGGNMLAHGSLASSKTVVSGNTPSVASGEVYVEFSSGYISNYLANALLDFAFRNQSYTVPSTYVALTTATISDSDTGSTISEPSGNGYARKLVNPNGGSAPTWGIASGGTTDNDDNIDLGPASGGSWGTIVATALVDASSAGNVLFYDNGVTDQEVGDGDTYRFAAGDFDVSLD